MADPNDTFPLFKVNDVGKARAFIGSPAAPEPIIVSHEAFK